MTYLTHEGKIENPQVLGELVAKVNRRNPDAIGMHEEVVREGLTRLHLDESKGVWVLDDDVNTQQ